MNKPTLGGALFVWRGVDQDYHFEQSIECLAEFCDKVSISVGGNDGTHEKVVSLVFKLTEKYPDKSFHIRPIFEDEWNAHQGREKLSYFTNVAIEQLDTEWVCNLQADEILTPESYPIIRAIIENPSIEGVVCARRHFWYDPCHYLTVPFERMPCGTQIVRLAKQKYRAIDDAESIHVDGPMVYHPDIEILHFGFVRDPKRHMTKIRHMQGEVFQIEVDKRCDGMEVFDPSKFFSRSDVTRYERELPPLIQSWAKERYPEL